MPMQRVAVTISVILALLAGGEAHARKLIASVLVERLSWHDDETLRGDFIIVRGARIVAARSCGNALVTDIAHEGLGSKITFSTGTLRGIEWTKRVQASCLRDWLELEATSQSVSSITFEGEFYISPQRGPSRIIKLSTSDFAVRPAPTD
jgi:hypothetical protein